MASPQAPGGPVHLQCHCLQRRHVRSRTDMKFVDAKQEPISPGKFSLRLINHHFKPKVFWVWILIGKNRDKRNDQWKIQAGGHGQAAASRSSDGAKLLPVMATKINKVDPLLTEITNPILKNETFPSTATDKIPPNRLVVFLCPSRPSSLSHPCLSRLSRVLCPRPCPCLSRPFPSPLLCLWQGPWGLVPLYRLSNLCPFPFRLFHLCPSHLCLKTGMVATTQQDNSRGLWKAGNQRVVSSPEKQSVGSNIRGFHSYCMGPRWFTHHLRP